MDDRARVWTTRILAPIVFLVAATALVILVQRAVDDGPSVSTATTASPSSEAADTGAAADGRRYYRIRQGDTLEAIASRFDTTVEQLLELNPGIDPLALTPRQRIRVA
jgi:LysM repeat protein